MTTSLVMPMAKASVGPSAVLPEPKAAASVMPEAGKAAKFGVEPPPPELDDEEELVEDIDDVSEEIEEEVEEELGLDSQDDDVDIWKSLRISWMTLTSTATINLCWCRAVRVVLH